MKRRSRRFRARDEAELDRSDPAWVEWGGERYWAVDETPGGAPIGLTVAEVDRAMEEDRRPGWARAKDLLRLALDEPGGAEPEVGHVVHLGEGLSRDAYGAVVERGHETHELVVLLPYVSDAERDGRVRAEAALLARLAPLSLPCRVPRPYALLPTQYGLSLVRQYVRGVPLDLRAGRMLAEPWEVVAELAAGLHGLPGDTADEVVGHATRRAHGEAQLRALSWCERVQDARVHAARAWLADNLPPEQPAALLHGDLLGQNILLSPPDPRPWLIDWEFALRGDPAYDLAIVTRGVRQPFQVADGFERLLAAYRARSTREVRANEVRFHELSLLLGFARAAKGKHVREQHLHKLEVVLRKAERA